MHIAHSMTILGIPAHPEPLCNIVGLSSCNLNISRAWCGYHHMTRDLPVVLVNLPTECAPTPDHMTYYSLFMLNIKTLQLQEYTK